MNSIEILLQGEGIPDIQLVKLEDGKFVRDILVLAISSGRVSRLLANSWFLAKMKKSLWIRIAPRPRRGRASRCGSMCIDAVRSKPL